MDAQKLLEQFLGSGSLAERAKGALGGGAGQGGLGGLLGQLGGALGAGQNDKPQSGQSQAGQPRDHHAPARSGGLGDLLGNIPGGAMGGLAAGGILGVLLGNKSARKMAGGLLSVGAAAALGALAHRAWQNWRAGRDAAAAPVATAADAPADNSPFLPTQSADGAPFALALIKAMIAAANADGHIGPEEHKQIFDAANRAGFDADAKAFLFDALSNPPSVRQIASMASGMEQAAELYLAARLAIDPDHPSEKAFLDALASAMELPPAFVEHLERQVTGAPA